MPSNIKPEPPDALYVTESSDGQMTGTPIPIPVSSQQQTPPRSTQPPAPTQSKPQTAKPPQTTPSNNNEQKKPDAMDDTSSRGIFGWTSISNVNVPVLFRGKDKIHYVAVRIVETKLLSRYPNVYPQELKEKPPLHSYYVTANEVKLLNEINTHHCDFEYGHEPFTEKDLVVKLTEFNQFFKVVKASFPEEKLKQMRFNPQSITRGGWVQLNNTVLPYVYRDDKERHVPYQVVKYAAGLMTDSQLTGQRGKSHEVIFLNRICKEAVVDFEFDSSLELVPLEVLRIHCKPTVVELPSHDPFSHAKFIPPSTAPVVIPPPPGYQVPPPGIHYGPGIMLNPANRMMHPMQMNRAQMNQVNGAVPRPGVQPQTAPQYIQRAPPAVQRPILPGQHHVQAQRVIAQEQAHAARLQVVTSVGYSTPQQVQSTARPSNPHYVTVNMNQSASGAAQHQYLPLPSQLMTTTTSVMQSNATAAVNAPNLNRQKEAPAVSKPPNYTLQLTNIQGKHFLIVKQENNNDLILVQDVVKQFFKPIAINEFIYALTDVLKVELKDCSASLSSVMIRARRLNEQKLISTKLIRVKDFTSVFPKLHYIYKDKLLAAKLAKQNLAAKAAATTLQNAATGSEQPKTSADNTTEGSASSVVTGSAPSTASTSTPSTAPTSPARAPSTSDTLTSVDSAVSSAPILTTSAPSTISLSSDAATTSEVTETVPTSTVSGIAITMASTSIATASTTASSTIEAVNTPAENQKPNEESEKSEDNTTGEVIPSSTESSSVTTPAISTTGTSSAISTTSSTITTETTTSSTETSLVPTSDSSTAAVINDGSEDTGLKINLVMSVNESPSTSSAPETSAIAERPELICLDDE